MNQRLVQYDILKGIGILLVVICHAGLDGFSKEFIYTFHMPLFFFVSGCFFKDNDFANLIVKNIKQLLIPYLLFAFCMIVARTLRSIDFQSVLPSISGSLLALSPIDESDPCLYESIWFLLCLFTVRIIYWFINRICKGVLLIKVVVCCISYFMGCALQVLNVNLPFFVDTAFSVLLLYALGDCFHNKGYDSKAVPWYLSLMGVLVCVWACHLFHPIVELKINKYPIYLVLLSVVTIVSFYYICKYLFDHFENKKSYVLGFLEKSGASSLSILGFHNPIIWIFGHYIRLIPAPSIVVLIFTVFTTVIVIFYLEKIIYKLAPFLLGKS